MKIICLTVGSLGCNCYLLKDEVSGDGAVIDPGGEGERIIQACESEALRPRYIINTHGHADHTGADAELKHAYPTASLCIGRQDADLLADSVRNLSVMLDLKGAPPGPDLLLEEGQRLEFGACVLRVLQTPGHTPGSICLMADGEEPAVVFCGDLIFKAGVGRTDLPGGSLAALRRSIQGKIFTLPDRTVLLPGHEERTTVGAEKKMRALTGMQEG